MIEPQAKPSGKKRSKRSHRRKREVPLPTSVYDGGTPAGSKMTPERMAAALEVLVTGKSYAEAAKAAGVARQTLFDWRIANDAFDAACKEAVASGVDGLEDEAHRRAVEGWEEPVFQKGFEVGRVRKYSDNLLIMMLKGRRPEVYRERHEVTGPNGNPLIPESPREIIASRLDVLFERLSLKFTKFVSGLDGRPDVTVQVEAQTEVASASASDKIASRTAGLLASRGPRKSN
jgi:hypothetical protein